VQNRTELAPGTTSSEQGSDGVTYGVNDKGQRTHKMDPNTQKWVQMTSPTPAENPELQPAVTDVPTPTPGPKPPTPGPTPTPSAGGVDPKDQKRFQELIDKFKSVKKSNGPTPPAPPKSDVDGPSPKPPATTPISPTGPQAQADAQNKTEPVAAGSQDQLNIIKNMQRELGVEPDGKIGPITRTAMTSKPDIAAKYSAGGELSGAKSYPGAKKAAPKPEVQPAPPKRDWYDPRGWIGKESLSEDDRILSMIKGIKVK